VAHNNVGALEGLKVIDLTHVMAGPVCTLLLADLGAEVIKIERPPEGDDSRHMAPPYIGDESAAYLIVNRHKRGIVLNLKHESGREALLRLLENADVLVEKLSRRQHWKSSGLVLICSVSAFRRSSGVRSPVMGGPVPMRTVQVSISWRKP